MAVLFKGLGRCDITLSLAEDLAHACSLPVEGTGQHAGAILLTVAAGMWMRRVNGQANGVMSGLLTGRTLALGCF